MRNVLEMSLQCGEKANIIFRFDVKLAQILLEIFKGWINFFEQIENSFYFWSLKLKIKQIDSIEAIYFSNENV